MSFTYDITTDRGKVRFLVGDIDSTDALLQDAEVDYCLDQTEGNYEAAALAAEAIAAIFARKVSKTVGPLSIEAGQKYDHYIKLAASLRARVGMSVSPTAGGISIARKDTLEEDTDRVEPGFTRGMMDNPLTSPTDGRSS